MKKFLYILIFSLVFINGCNRETTVESIDMNENIYAKVNESLYNSKETEEYFFKVKGLGKDESLKINLVKYDGDKVVTLVEGIPKKYKEFYIKIEKNKYSFVEILDFNKAKVGNSFTYTSEDNLASRDYKESIIRHLDQKEVLNKDLILYQKDMTNKNSLVHNTYGLDKAAKSDLKDQFGYAVIISKVKHEEKS